MKAQLILLDNPIIVTDEEIKDGDWYFYGNRFDIKELNQFKKGIDDTAFLKEQGIFKIISTNKPIDYNGIDFGIVDVEEFVRNRYGIYPHIKIEDLYEDRREDIIHDIEVINDWQQLNEKNFTFEDIQDALRLGYDIGKDFEEDAPNISLSALNYQIDNFPKYLSLPKTFDIEIEETPTNIKIIKKL